MNPWDKYQQDVTKVKKYKLGQEDLYLLAKLSEETGETAKEIRKKIDGETMVKDLTSELGDLLWCVAAIAKQNNIPLSKIVEVNYEKLQTRNLL